MFIDNKTTFNTHGIKSVADFIKHYSEKSPNVNFDIVTGFFNRSAFQIFSIFQA